MDFSYYADLLTHSLDQVLTPKVFIVLAALTGSLAIMLLSRGIDFALALTPQAGRTVMRYRGASESSTLEELGGRALKRLPVLGTLFGLEDNRRWLALKAPPPSVPAIVGLALLLGAAGLLFAVITMKPFLGLLAVVGFLYPFMRLRSQATKVRLSHGALPARDHRHPGGGDGSRPAPRSGPGARFRLDRPHGHRSCAG